MSDSDGRQGSRSARASFTGGLFAGKTQYFEHSCLATVQGTKQFSKFGHVSRAHKFKDGKELYKAGSPAINVYLVGKGRVTVDYIVGVGKDKESGSVMSITKTQGDIFGHEAISDTGSGALLYSGTATVSGGANLVVMNIEVLKEAYEKDIEFYEKAEEYLGKSIPQCLMDTGCYTTEALVKHPELWQMWRMEYFRTGTVVFEQGDFGKVVYVVYQGGVSLEMKPESITDDTLRIELGPGQIFGELGVLVDRPRDGTVTVSKDTILLMLDATAFNDMLYYHPSIGEKMTRHARSLIIHDMSRFKIPFFEMLSDEMLDLLGNLATIIQFPPGEVLFDIGEPGDRFYIVSSGVIGIYVPIDTTAPLSIDSSSTANMREIARVGAGRYFGEMSLVSDNPRCATAKAITRSVVLSITKTKFDRFTNANPELAMDFQIKIAKYNVKFEQILQHVIGIEYFRKHCMAEYCGENLEFWIAAGKYEEVTAGGLQQEALAIYNKFVKPNSPDEINVAFNTRTRVSDNVKSQNFSSNLYADARKEIFLVMQRDIFPRFQLSPHFQEFLSKFE